MDFDFRGRNHGNTLFLVTMVTIGNIQKSLTEIRQHINTNIRAKFKQIMINQCLEICLLWVSYHFVNEV